MESKPNSENSEHRKPSRAVQQQRAILASDAYWGIGTAAHKDPCGADLPRRRGAASSVEDNQSDSNRHIHAGYDEKGEWHVTVDPIEGCLLNEVVIEE